MPLNFIITDAGRAAIAQVGGAIGPVTLTKIAIGSAGYTPLASRTALQTEIKRLDPSGSSVPVPGTISLTAQDNSADSYSVKEIGLITNNNVLFAICAQSAVIMTKASGSTALFAMDFVMTNVPAGTVTVGNVGFTYSQATETAMGVLSIATTAEAQAGTINTKIITPLRLAEVTATETRKGVIALATSAEAQALAPDATKALTVARLVDRTATTSRVGVVELADNTETQTGTATTLAVTPAGLASRTATESRAGIVQLASTAEASAGTITTKAVTPAALKSSLAAYSGSGHTHDAAAIVSGTLNNARLTPATSTVAGIVELADNTETQTGTDTARAVTPASLASAAALFVPPGAVMPFAMNAAPSGWLAANGAAVSRTTYAALFTAIGTAYGAGNGSSTFALPDLRGYFVRGSGTNADGTAAGTFGAKQADAFQGHRHSSSSSAQRVTYGKVIATGAGWTGENQGTSVLDPTTDGTNDTPRTASETRPKNIALLYCIKI